jgi:hypothetical protein
MSIRFNVCFFLLQILVIHLVVNKTLNICIEGIVAFIWNLITLLSWAYLMKVFKKRVMRTKFDIKVFTKTILQASMSWYVRDNRNFSIFWSIYEIFMFYFFYFLTHETFSKLFFFFYFLHCFLSFMRHVYQVIAFFP